jgi:hypothetical protein
VVADSESRIDVFGTGFVMVVESDGSCDLFDGAGW